MHGAFFYLISRQMNLKDLCHITQTQATPQNSPPFGCHHSLIQTPLSEFFSTRNFGIYLHIPFCMRRCRYCAFVSTVPKRIPADDYTQAILREFALQKDLYAPRQLLTIYLGGGTPSMLPDSCLERILSVFFKEYGQPPEVTLEANPEHVTRQRSEIWKSIGFSRISLGIQSFDDDLLKLLGRHHDACQAQKSFEILRNAGFNDLSIDLIYGAHCDNDSEQQSLLRWQNSLKIVQNLQPEHLSCYELSLETHTPLWTLSKRGTQILCDESTILTMMRMIPEMTGMQRYEISNYGRNNYYSSHNLSCWAGLPYLGLGPGAHSLQISDGHICRWSNTDRVQQWISTLNQENRLPDPQFRETLSPQSHLAERLICAARTLLPWDPAQIASQLRADIAPYLPGIQKAQNHGLIAPVPEIPGCFRTTPLGIELNNRLDEMIFEGFGD